MADKTPVEIPFSQLEYTVTVEPMLGLVGKAFDLVAPFMEALTPFGFVFDETEFQFSSVKASDHVLTFKQPSTAHFPRTRVAVRWSTLTISVEQLDWSEAESTAKLCSIALETLVRVGHANVRSQEVNLMLHVQSKTTPTGELTSVLLTPKARELMDGAIVGQGLILQRKNAMILIDNSAAFANALFVRIKRTFDHTVGIEQIGETLLRDERQLWDILGLEGEL
jgi:hypothetical protein